MSDSHVAGGHKAALSNPKVSEEAKQHSKDILDKKFGGSGGDSGAKADDMGGKNPGNVVGGLKSTLSNPKTSEEAKQNAQERLDNM